MKKIVLVSLFNLLCFQGIAQLTIQGRVMDSLTQKPIKGAVVFFNRTSIWDVTDEKGYFEISIKKRTNIPLTISYLGYEKVMVRKPFLDKKLVISMVLAKNEIPPVVIVGKRDINQKSEKAAIDIFGMELQQAEKWRELFIRLFIGKGESANRTEIKNKEILHFTYDSIQKAVYISAREPLIIENRRLKYRITYALDTARIGFNKNENWNILLPETFLIAGESFFQDLLDPEKNNARFYRRRKETYLGSVLHFMRSLRDGKLRKQGFKVYQFVNVPAKNPEMPDVTAKDSIIVKKRVRFEIFPWEDFVEIIPPSTFKIMYKDNLTEVKAKQNFGIDKLGIFFPWHALQFIGHLGRTGISSALPLNYSPQE